MARVAQENLAIDGQTAAVEPQFKTSRSHQCDQLSTGEKTPTRRLWIDRAEKFIARRRIRVVVVIRDDVGERCVELKLSLASEAEIDVIEWLCIATGQAIPVVSVGRAIVLTRFDANILTAAATAVGDCHAACAAATRLVGLTALHRWTHCRVQLLATTCQYQRCTGQATQRPFRGVARPTGSRQILGTGAGACIRVGVVAVVWRQPVVSRGYIF